MSKERHRRQCLGELGAAAARLTCVFFLPLFRFVLFVRFVVLFLALGRIPSP